jgi:glyoxylase-like metal-dependent hydrolase (beta-lactamase superfamily II)
VRIERFPVGPLDNNLYLLTPDRGDLQGAGGSKSDAILVDPSLDSAGTLRAILARGITVKRILLTHAHIDHILMAKPFRDATGAPVWLHEGDRMLYELGPVQAEQMGLAWPGTTPIDHWIEDGEDVGLPGIDVRAIHTPGHSPGGVTFVTPAGLVAGDVLFRESVGRVDLPGGDWETLVRSIRGRLFQYDRGTVVYPGHGPPTTIGHEMKVNPFVGASATLQA